MHSLHGVKLVTTKWRGI